MGKNKARHILHGVLDCLPIILIPIFMIYSQNHDITGNEIVQETSKVVDFNQQVKTTDLYDYNGTNYNLTHSDYTYTISIVNVGANTYPEILKIFSGLVETHKYYVSLDGFSNNGILGLKYFLNGDSTQYYFNNWYNNLITMPLNINRMTLYCALTTNLSAQSHTFYVNVYDFTQMFGEGNEPSAQEFNTYFNVRNFEYTQSQEYVIENYETITYNDSDIMSQSFYCLYNSVDKYFNMGNVFGMKNLYTWFEVNIFGGTASPSIYIVWNIVLYEFVMDLLFLLYGLFMFFIDMCKRLMEKPLNSIK